MKFTFLHLTSITKNTEILTGGLWESVSNGFCSGYILDNSVIQSMLTGYGAVGSAFSQFKCRQGVLE